MLEGTFGDIQSNPLPRQGVLEQVTQECVRRGTLHGLPGQPPTGMPFPPLLPPLPSWLDFFRSIERFPFLLSVFWRAKSPKWMFKSTGCFQILATEKQPCFPSAPWKNVLKLEQLSPFSLLNARGRLCFQNILFFLVKPKVLQEKQECSQTLPCQATFPSWILGCRAPWLLCSSQEFSSL